MQFTRMILHIPQRSHVRLSEAWISCSDRSNSTSFTCTTSVQQSWHCQSRYNHGLHRSYATDISETRLEEASSAAWRTHKSTSGFVPLKFRVVLYGCSRRSSSFCWLSKKFGLGIWEKVVGWSLRVEDWGQALWWKGELYYGSRSPCQILRSEANNQQFSSLTGCCARHQLQQGKEKAHKAR